MYKQVIVVRSDLKLSRGKTAAQAAHASVSAADMADKKIAKYWKNEGQKKVVLKVKDASALLAVERKCNELKVAYSLVRDAGMTELKPGTITCIGIGPDKEEKINKVTGSLPLMK
ncbi:MAG: peptidyl-tRNA hydrolase [Candidatus Aenigmarchaeota archaeon]|nr:peptidyl-tRNA hydrolase [Candidatus Aenigmarchaeota archaeon]